MNQLIIAVRVGGLLSLWKIIIASYRQSYIDR